MTQLRGKVVFMASLCTFNYSAALDLYVALMKKMPPTKELDTFACLHFCIYTRNTKEIGLTLPLKTINQGPLIIHMIFIEYWLTYINTMLYRVHQFDLQFLSKYYDTWAKSWACHFDQISRFFINSISLNFSLESISI